MLGLRLIHVSKRGPWTPGEAYICVNERGHHRFRLWRIACSVRRHYLNHRWSLQWCDNERDGVSSHQPLGCLLKRLFRYWSKKTSKLRVLAFVRDIHRWSLDSPHKGHVTRKTFPFDDVIMDDLLSVDHCVTDYTDILISHKWIKQINLKSQDSGHCCQASMCHTYGIATPFGVKHLGQQIWRWMFSTKAFIEPNWDLDIIDTPRAICQ